MNRQIQTEADELGFFGEHGNQIKCHYGEQAFFEKCRDTGVYGLIIPDLPFELSQRLKQQFSHYGVKIMSKLYR